MDPAEFSRGSRLAVVKDGISMKAPQKQESTIMKSPTQPGASAGCSLTVSQSTDYAKQKIEVSAWCTLPCEPTEEALAEAYNVAAAWVTQEVTQRSNEAWDTFFPDINPSE